MIKKKFKIIGMHCTSCALIIDGDLEDLDGVISSATSYARQETIIEFDELKVDHEKIIEIIKRNGYSAVALE
jgi:copper chaperone CopZ